METVEGSPCSVIKFHKGAQEDLKDTGEVLQNTESHNSIENVISNGIEEEDSATYKTDQQTTAISDQVINDKNEEKKAKDQKGETEIEMETGSDDIATKVEVENVKLNLIEKMEIEGGNNHLGQIKVENSDLKFEDLKAGVKAENTQEMIKSESEIKNEVIESESLIKSEDPNCKLAGDSGKVVKKERRGRKRKFPVSEETGAAVITDSEVVQDVQATEEAGETDFDDEEEEAETKPRRRGRCKKNPDIIPAHLTSDIVLGYKILLKFLETPQFSGFHKPFSGAAATDESQIVCLNQIKKKFEENSYKRIAEFVNDVREMLTNIYESRNSVAIKRALRLEQVLEQRIAQLPNYLRPQCALILSPDDTNNSHSKIRMNKGGGFVSLLLEKAEKRRTEKDKEKRKLLAEERKMLKEEQDKDVQEWEKNVLLKDHEEAIKSMWELPAIGHFIHLCTDILNIGEVSQFEIERMLLMPQCSESLDLIMTALLSNSLVRAKLDRTPPMPYSIWGPLVRTRVITWYRAWHRERNAQKVFEEIGVEPEFWEVLGPDINPLDYYYFHELSLVQRVWILKALCDVDFVRKKTVHDNIRAQTLDELNPVYLGVDRHGNRYIQLKQFCGPDVRIYRQCVHIIGDITPAELIESTEGFEYREGPITVDKVFKDIWEVGEKNDSKQKKKKMTTKANNKKVKKYSKPANTEVFEKKNLRQSARAKQKTYVDWSDSDQSDTDLATLKSRLQAAESSETLYRPFSDKEFISLSVFRLPRDKVNKPTPKKSNYVRKSDIVDAASSDKNVKNEDKKDPKSRDSEEEASADLDLKQMQDIQMDLAKTLADEMNEDEFNLDKLTDFKLDKTNKDKFTVANLENLKMVLKKGNMEESGETTDPGKSDQPSTENNKPEIGKPLTDEQYDTLYKHNVPDHLKPDSSKFYLVVDSVDGLRQLISKFASQENDLEIISRSTKSNKKNSSNSSCEVELIERLQNLLVELEPWELDFIKSSRANREKMYKEYTSFINRPADFVHPNESYWMKIYEEPAPASTASSTTTTNTTVTSTATTVNSTRASAKDSHSVSADGVSTQPSIVEELAPRKRTRVTRLQLKLDEQDELDEELGEDEPFESSESDDNWEMPQSSKRRSKKESTPKTPKISKRPGGKRAKISNEKVDIQATQTDKATQSPSVDKAKKALFWGPRSSDPSEDLNWETNRQKILEQHNSPVKKVLYKQDEIIDDMVELETALQKTKKLEVPSGSVITASPKRVVAQIPGNKKPYYSSAQLKAMESQAKPQEGVQTVQQRVIPRTNLQKLTSQKPVMKTTSTQMNTDVTMDPSNEGNKTPVKGSSLAIKSPVLTQMINRRFPAPTAIKKPPQPVNRAPQTVNRMPAPTTIAAQNVNKNDPPLKTFQGPARVQQIVRPLNRMQQPNVQKPVGQTAQVVQVQANQIQRIQSGNQIIQIQQAGNQNQQKGFSQIQQIQIHQPISQGQQIGQIQQIHIQQPVSQMQQTYIQQNSRPVVTNVQNVRLQHPVQIQTRLISPQQSIQLQGNKVGTIQQTVQLQVQKPGQQVQVQNQIQHYQVQSQTNQNQQLQVQNQQQQVQVQQEQQVQVSQQIQIQQQQQQQQMQVQQQQQKIQVQQQQQQIQAQQQQQQQIQIQQQQQQIQAQQQQQQIQAQQQQQQIQVQQVQIQTNRIPANQQQGQIILQQGPGQGQVQAKVINIQQVVQSQSQGPANSDNEWYLSDGTHLVKADLVQHLMQKDKVLTLSIDPKFDTNKQLYLVRKNPEGSANTNPNNNPSLNRLQPSTSQPQQNILVFNKSVQQTMVPTSVANFVYPGSYIVSEGGPVQTQMDQQQNVTIVQQNPTYIIQQKPNVLNKGAQPQVIKIINPQSMTSNQNIIISSPQNIKFTNQVIRPVNQTIVTSESRNQNQNQQQEEQHQQQQKIQQPPLQQQTQMQPMQQQKQQQRSQFPQQQQQQLQQKPISTLRFIRPQNVISTNQNIIQNKINPVQSPRPTVNTVRLPANQVRFVANSNQAVRFVQRNPTPVKSSVITSTAQQTSQPPGIIAANTRPTGNVTTQAVRYQAVSLQPTVIRTGQKGPTKLIARTATALTNPIIIKLEDDEDDIKIVGERKQITKPVTVDYLHGELSAKNTPEGWKYSVKTSDGREIVLTNEQVEARRAANNGAMI